MTTLRQVDPSLIDGPTANARFDLGDLKELAASITALGLLQPILVKPCGNRFTLVAGARRLSASVLARQAAIPVLELDPTADTSVVNLVENLHRVDLSPIEKGQAIRDLIIERNISQRDAANLTGLSQPTVSRLVRVIDLLHPELKTACHAGTMSFDKAYTFCQYDHDTQLRMWVARRTQAKGKPRRPSQAEVHLSAALVAFRTGDEDAALDLARKAVTALEVRKRNGSTSTPKVRSPGRPAKVPAPAPTPPPSTPPLSPGFEIFERQRRAAADTMATPPEAKGAWRPKVKCADCKHWLTIEVGKTSDTTLAAHRTESGCEAPRKALRAG